MTQFSKWKTIGYAASIFAAGGVSGGAIGVYYARSRLLASQPVPVAKDAIAMRIMSHLGHRLNLTPDQAAKIRPIADDAAAQIEQIIGVRAGEVTAILDKAYAQISPILTPDQRARLDEIVKERREMLQRLPGHRRLPPGVQGPPDHDSHPDDDHDGGSPPSI